VIVTGCMGNEADVIRARFPDVLAVTGAHQYEQVVDAVHTAAPPSQGPFVDLIPSRDGEVKLTPRHYSYLKISEGCNHSCSFCIIPQLRGKLASRRIDAVLREAEKLVAAGTKELLVISQDTSAYGVDIRHESRMWKGREVRAHMTDLARELGNLRTADGTPPWVRMHYVYPYPHVDDIIPLMAEGLITPYLDIPFQHAAPNVLRAMKRPANEAKVLERVKKWREICPDLAIARPSWSASPARPRRISSICSTGWMRRSSTASAVSVSSPSKAPPPTICPAPCPRRSRKSATPA
jgi:ribosomal protein S12 methylthiotransferase